MPDLLLAHQELTIVSGGDLSTSEHEMYRLQEALSTSVHPYNSPKSIRSDHLRDEVIALSRTPFLPEFLVADLPEKSEEIAVTTAVCS